MKKQRNQFIVICVILVIAVAGYIGLTVYNNNQEAKQAEEEEAATIYAIQISVDDITAFSYTLDGETLSFELVDDEWVYTDDTSIDLDEDAVEDMIDVVESFTAEDVVEADDYEDLADFGLDEPACTVTVTTEDGTVTFYAGDYNLVTYYYYLKRSDDDRIFLCESDLSASFTSTVEDLTAEEEETETETEE